jgi:hypothetical protein
MIELEDSQILLASCVVTGRANNALFQRREATWYLSRLYRFYRWGHLQYAGRMLLRTIGLRPTPSSVWAVSMVMWSVIRIRLQIANLASFVAPLREPKNPTNKAVNRSGEVGRI